MKKINKIITFLITILILSSCSSVREGFSSQKKKSVDEFLVEKKSPLIMPPDFDELPLPDEDVQTTEKPDEKNIKSLILNDGSSVDNEKNNSNQNIDFENLIIDKIKKN